MSAIAYSAAVALLGASAAVTSQVVSAVDAPVERPIEIAAPVKADTSYDFSKFAVEVVSPVGQVDRLEPVEVAALGQSQLHIIVRDKALAKKADRLAATAANAEVDVTQLDIAAPVPLPKARPAFALQNAAAAPRRSVRRNLNRKRESIRRPVRVAEASTSPRKRLARRLRSKGWLIGAFR